jgi:hypothetical protein
MFLLRADNPNDLARICEFLEQAHVVVRGKNDDGTVRVSTPGAASPLHEEREIVGYVTTWNALNPQRRLEIVEPE